VSSVSRKNYSTVDFRGNEARNSPFPPPLPRDSRMIPILRSQSAAIRAKERERFGAVERRDR